MQDLIKKISSMSESSASAPFIAAIDGRCGAGKSTLAAMLKREGWTVFHMDDFFLGAHQRTPERLSAPGGNADRERFEAEILRPLSSGAREISYRPFDCKSMSLAKPVVITPGKFCAVEGSYCCHPELWEYYDLHIFLTVDSDEQMRRITERCGSERAEAFKNRWIPLEEKYFSAFRLEERADIVFHSQGRN